MLFRRTSLIGFSVCFAVALGGCEEEAQTSGGGYQPGVLARNPNDPLYSESGIFGDATLATAAKGKAALEVLTREWLKALEGFSELPLVRKSPP